LLPFATGRQLRNLLVHCLAFAGATRDWEAWQQLAAQWPRAGRDSSNDTPGADDDASVGPRIFALVRSLHVNHPRAAMALACAEAQRRPTAETWYVVGWLEWQAGEPGAGAHFARAEELARAPAQAGLRERAMHYARIRQMRLPMRAPQAAASVAQALRVTTSADLRRQLAVLLLASESRFTRASGLQVLVELAASPRERDREGVFELGAAFVDGHAEQLTPLEWDRAVSLFQRIVPAALRAPVVRRAEAIRAWVAPGPKLDAPRIAALLANAPELSDAVHAARAYQAEQPATPRTAANGTGVNIGAECAVVVFAIDAGDWQAAAAAIDALARVPIHAFTPAISGCLHAALRCALVAPIELLTNSALILLVRVLESGPRVAPPRGGYAALARELRPRDRILDLLLRLGLAHGEPAAIDDTRARLLRTATTSTFAQQPRAAAEALNHLRALGADISH
jgi:hypothetical protein